MSLSSTPWPRRGLYAITPDDSSTARLLARVEPVLAAGAAVLQYRNKTANAALRREQASALLPLCRAHGVPLIVNDDLRLARAIGADGVHLGGDDGDVRAARNELGDTMIIGASCYDVLSRALNAKADGASYVAFGAFHPSTTKPNAKHAELSLLHDTATLGLPRVAIGGITSSNARALIAAGADFIAVIGALFNAPDPAKAARAFIDCFKDFDA